MKKALRFFSIILVLAACLGCFAVSTYAKGEPDLSEADAVCLYNTNTEKNILSKNMQKKIFPGSSVKMMTGLLACEMLSSRLGETVTVTEEMLCSASGYNVKLKPGMSVTLENLLYGVLCGGGNDAALALAVACSGSVDAFVELMNSKALEWGLKSTNFTNPTGLDDSNMYSTLADIMIIAKKAYENTLYMDISSAVSYVYKPSGAADEIKFFNRNALISTFYTSGYRNLNAAGLTAGNTELGGYCVITYAEKRDTGYLCAVMGADADDDTVYSYSIANSLIDYAFDNFNYIKLAERGQYICDAPLQFAMPQTDSDDTYVECVIMNDVYALTYSGISPEADLEYRYYLHEIPTSAPIYAGDVMGGVDIIYNGEVLATEKLIAAESVSASKLLLYLNNLKSFFSGRLFILCVVFLLIISLSYAYFAHLRFKRKKVGHINYKNYY